MNDPLDIESLEKTYGKKTAILFTDMRPMTDQSHPEIMAEYKKISQKHNIQYPPKIYVSDILSGAYALPEHNAMIIGEFMLSRNKEHFAMNMHIIAHEAAHILAGHTGKSRAVTEHIADRLGSQLLGSTEGALKIREHAHEMMQLETQIFKNPLLNAVYSYSLNSTKNKMYGTYHEERAHLQAVNPGDTHLLNRLIENHNDNKGAFHPASHIAEANPARPGRLESKSARVVTIATMGVNTTAAINALTHGDKDAALHYGGTAVTSAAMEVVQHEAAWKAVANVTGKIVSERASTIVKAVGGKVPVVGAVVGIAFGVAEIGGEAWDLAHGKSNWKKLASTTLSAVAGAVGGFLGFGAGEALQEGVALGTRAAFGEKNAARHSATVELAMMSYELATSSGTKQLPNKPKNLSSVEIDKQLQAMLPDLERKGWGKHIGKGDAHVTLSELKATITAHGVQLSNVDKNKDGHITGGEITRALSADAKKNHANHR